VALARPRLGAAGITIAPGAAAPGSGNMMVGRHHGGGATSGGRNGRRQLPNAAGRWRSARRAGRRSRCSSPASSARAGRRARTDRLRAGAAIPRTPDRLPVALWSPSDALTGSQCHRLAPGLRAENVRRRAARPAQHGTLRPAGFARLGASKAIGGRGAVQVSTANCAMFAERDARFAEGR
jgi:hypothetical protein